MLSSTLAATGTLTVACTNSDAWSIALSAGAGAGATVADRRMTRSGGTDQVHYQLYQSASYATPWGDGTNGARRDVPGRLVTMIRAIFRYSEGRIFMCRRKLLAR